MLCKAKLEGSKIRSKAFYLEEYEKPSKYFLRREAIRGNSKLIKKK